MDKETFDGRVERLLEVAKVINRLPASMEEGSFILLEPYITAFGKKEKR